MNVMQDNLKAHLRIVNYVGAAAVVLLLGGVTVFGIVPMYKRGTTNINAARDLRQTLNKFEGLSTTLAHVEEQRKETEARLAEVEKRLPSSLEASKFNSELTQVAKSAGIRVESMPKPEPLQDAGGYKALPVEIVGKGDWASCEKFLTGIRAMNRLTRLDSVTFDLDKESLKQNPENPICLMTVKFSTFFMER
jgi:Tfp pilus assembly protein PilO